VARHAGPRTATANCDRSPTTPGTPSIRSSHQKAHKSWQQKNQPVHFTSSLLCHQLSVHQVLYPHTATSCTKSSLYTCIFMLPIILLIPSLLLHFSFFKSRGIRLRQTLFSIATIDSDLCTILTLCLSASIPGVRDKNEANLQVLAVSCGQTLAPPSTFHDFSPCFT